MLSYPTKISFQQHNFSSSRFLVNFQHKQLSKESYTNCLIPFLYSANPCYSDSRAVRGYQDYIPATQIQSISIFSWFLLQTISRWINCKYMTLSLHYIVVELRLSGCRAVKRPLRKQNLISSLFSAYFYHKRFSNWSQKMPSSFLFIPH